MMSRFTPVQDDEWITPKMNGYQMKCCDCGLVHEIDFQVVKKSGFKKNGWYKFEDITSKEIGVRLRARRASK